MKPMHNGTSHLCTHVLCSSGQHVSPDQVPPTVKIQGPPSTFSQNKGGGEVNTKTSAASFQCQLLSICVTKLLGIPLVTQSKENKIHTHEKVKEAFSWLFFPWSIPICQSLIMIEIKETALSKSLFKKKNECQLQRYTLKRLLL